MSKTGKIAVVVILAIAIVGVVVVKQMRRPGQGGPGAKQAANGLPRLLDLGAGKCIPCKMMAPILEELATELKGRLVVEVIDITEDRTATETYNIEIIPTQIFFDATGKELFRHQGFLSKADILAKWKELGVDLAAPAPSVARAEPLAKDTRPRDRVCAMCDGDIEPRTRTTVATAAGDVALCSPHCFFIYYSSLRDPASVDGKVTTTDWVGGQPVPAASAAYVRGVDAAGRPTIKAFADKADAAAEQKARGGNVLDFTALRSKELAVRCAFCDRANYPEDAHPVKADGDSLHACCPMCALGVAARRKEDIEVEVKDPVTGELVRLKTMDGSVASLEPKTAVAWHGQKKGADGKMVSAGCFKQFFFTSQASLEKWLAVHPQATGKMVTIHQALAAKMKLTPEQISNACKIGECPPAK